MTSTMTEEEVNKVAGQINREQSNLISTKDFVEKEELYNSLIECIRKYHPSANTDIIEKAYRIADEAHNGQKRKSGEDYIIHPLSVALILADLEMDKETSAWFWKYDKQSIDLPDKFLPGKLFIEYHNDVIFQR